MPKRHSDISEIGYWSEVKIDIVREYAQAYSRILAARKNPRLTHVYIDAFSGSGYHVTKEKGELVWGSPTSVFRLDPPFAEYHFIDLDQGNIEVLRELVGSQTKGPNDPKRQIAGFEYLSEPLPMRNSTGSVVYYLIFASQKPVAAKIVRDIFNKYRNRTS